MARESIRKVPTMQHSSPSAKPSSSPPEGAEVSGLAEYEAAEPSSSPPEGAEVSGLADFQVRPLAGHNFKSHQTP